MTPIGIEGVFTASMMTLASALSDGESDLKSFLSVFVREEIISWHQSIRKPMVGGTARLRDLVGQNSRLVMNRAQILSCKTERDLVFFPTYRLGFY